jgi:DNA primase
MSETFQELSAELDLEAFFQDEGLKYKLARGSSGWQIHCETCPVCDDRRWRTYLNSESGAGNCFVCSATFNKLTFVFATLHGCLPEKDVHRAEWRQTIDRVKTILKDQGWMPKRTVTAAVENTVKLPLSFPLPTPDGENLIYLEARGVDADLAAYFHLRMCERGWWNYVKDDGSPGGQCFDNRIIIPVYDLDGALVTFQGRDISGTSDRKYLFPMGLPGTGRYLFNGQNAYGAKRAVLGEGAFDVIATKRALDEDVALRDVLPLGSFGKHLSFGSTDGNDQLSRFLELKRGGLEEVTIMWDGEVKVIGAALDAAKHLHGIGLRAKIALLPYEKDPNEVTADVVRAAFYGAQVYNSQLEIKWRLRNPYRQAKKPASIDF